MHKISVLILSSLIMGTLSAAPVVNTDAGSSDIQTALVQATPAPQTMVDTSQMSTDQRLDRLEKMVTTQGQLQIMQRLQQLQQQMQVVQGQNEVLRHQVQLLQAQQKTLVNQLANGEKVTLPKQTAMPAYASNDQAAYEQAYNLITAGNYPAAIKALTAFVKQYPKSSQVPNALYWQGEVLAAQGDNDDAATALQQLVSQFPKHARVPDAQLKLATIAIDNDKNDKAEQLLNTIISQSPDSPAASIAKNKLRLLKGS